MTLARRIRPELPIEHLVSSGGVVYRRGGHGIAIVLCGRTSGGMWGLPKGTPNEGESMEETALREVREETGLDVRIEREIGMIEYWFTRVEQGRRFHKRVHYFLMSPVGGSVDQHDHEYDVVRWFSAPDALRLLTYQNEAEILQRALALLDTDQPASGAPVWLRGASGPAEPRAKDVNRRPPVKRQMPARRPGRRSDDGR